jgi:hypothetical protein
MYPYLKRGIILFSTIVVFAGAGFYWKGTSLVRAIAQESLEKALSPIGIHEVEIDALSFGWGRIYLRDIQSKESPSNSTLSIQELDIAFSPFFGIKAIDMIGVSLDLKGTDQSSFSIEELKERLASVGKMITRFKTAALPQIAIRESSFIVPTHKGPLNVPLQMMTQTTVMRHQIMTLDFGEQGEARFSGQIILDFGQEGVSLDVHTTNIDLETPHFQLKAPEISLLCHLVKGETDGGQIEGFAKINQLKLHHYGTLLAPLEINLAASGTPEKFVLDELTITEEGGSSPKGAMPPALFEFEGSFEPARLYAQAVVAFQIPRLAKLWDFTPLFERSGAEKISIGGNLIGEGELVFDKDRLTTQTFDVKIKDVSFVRDGFSLEGASSHLILKGLMPLTTKGSQHVAIRQASLAGINLKDVRFSFLFDDKGMLQIDQFMAAALGGTLKAGRFRRITPAILQFETDFKGIELAEILKLTDMSTLSGQAKLGGNALMQYSPEEGVDVIQAQLDSISESGVIQYKPKKGNSGEPPVGQSEIEMAYNVLDNLHFTLLNIRLHHIPNNPGEMQGTVKILGSNPNVLNGYPFEFNIVTTGKLKDLVANTLKHMNPPADFQNKTTRK